MSRLGNPNGWLLGLGIFSLTRSKRGSQVAILNSLALMLPSHRNEDVIVETRVARVDWIE